MRADDTNRPFGGYRVLSRHAQVAWSSEVADLGATETTPEEVVAYITGAR